MNDTLRILAILALLAGTITADEDEYTEEPDPVPMAVTDADGDMLSDAWETTYGLDPGLRDTFSSGMGDYWDDPDHDGLANHSELVAGTDPLNANTYAGGTNDYNISSSGSYFGKLLTDNDHIDDRWEARYTPYTSLAIWDERDDGDGDGWDNWSERRAGSDPSSGWSYPKPTLTVTVDYNGLAASEVQTLVVQCHTDPYRQGTPDAVFQRIVNATNGYPFTVTLTEADLLYGHIRQGQNYLFAFFNRDGSTLSGMGPTWTPGDPAAVEDARFAIIDSGFGFGDNKVRLGLTDDAVSHARIYWGNYVSSSDRNPHTISVYHAVANTLVFTRSFTPPRTWLHEGDINAAKTAQFGLAWGVANGASAYRWTLDGINRGYVTNIYSATLSAPTLVSPLGTTVYSARPEFRFRLAEQATQYTIVIATASTFATPVYTNTFRAPARRMYDASNRDLVVCSPPIHIGYMRAGGVRFTAGSTYYWRVTGASPAKTNAPTASTASTFKWAPSATVASGGGMGWIRVALKSRARTSGQALRVEAYDNPAFVGDWVAATSTNSSSCTVTLPGLVAGRYYLRCFVDIDGGGIRGVTEPWSYARTWRDAQNPFAPLAVYARMRDADPVDCATLGP